MVYVVRRRKATREWELAEITVPGCQEKNVTLLDLPASAITEAVIDELRSRQLREETVSAVHELFQICNQARYAPHKTSQELEALIPRAEPVFRELQKLKA
jgi:hypothetical protein